MIFAAAFIIFTLRDDFRSLWDRMVLETRGGTIQEQRGSEIRIRQAADGHFWVNAELNGEKVRFLIDSGATTTSVSRRVADRARVRIRSGFPAMVQTANGIVAVQRGRADRLTVGSIERTDFPVHVSEAFGDMNVIGMNFLSTLSSWSVEGRTLILRP
jgi:aspartyl protease family protein